MGAAWCKPKDRDIEKVAELVRAGKAKGLDTSPAAYGRIISTRTFDDRLRTLERVRDAGIGVCCGGIVGMGESRRERAGLVAQVANLDALREQKKQVEQRVALLERQLPNKTEMDALLANVNHAGVARGLQFELFKPQAAVLKPYFAEIPVNLRVTGRYHEVAQFNADVAALSRIVSMQSLQLAHTKEGGLSMEAVAMAYRTLDPDEQAAQRKAAAAAAAAKAVINPFTAGAAALGSIAVAAGLAYRTYENGQKELQTALTGFGVAAGASQTARKWSTWKLVVLHRTTVVTVPDSSRSAATRTVTGASCATAMARRNSTSVRTGAVPAPEPASMSRPRSAAAACAMISMPTVPGRTASVPPPNTCSARYGSLAQVTSESATSSMPG